MVLFALDMLLKSIALLVLVVIHECHGKIENELNQLKLKKEAKREEKPNEMMHSHGECGIQRKDDKRTKKEERREKKKW